MDLAARNELVLKYDHLAVGLAARKFKRLSQRSCIPLDDLVSAAREATIRAVDTWYPSLGELEPRIRFKVQCGLQTELRTEDYLTRPQRRLCCWRPCVISESI